MNFSENKSIYLQIIEYAEEQILEKKWIPGEKVPSVRDMAGTLQVNPNTVMRAYEALQQAEVLENRRGIGHFVAEGADKTIRVIRKKEFLETGLPAFFRSLALMGVGFDELERRYNVFIKDEQKK
jgi:GntR family transcriptional regulator